MKMINIDGIEYIPKSEIERRELPSFNFLNGMRTGGEVLFIEDDRLVLNESLIVDGKWIMSESYKIAMRPGSRLEMLDGGRVEMRPGSRLKLV